MRYLWVLLALIPSLALAQPKSPPPPNITGSTPVSGHCVEWTGPHSYADNGAACSGTGAVNTVANSDGTLTISPTTGSVVASLALGHANVWTGAQTLDLPIFVTPALGTIASGNLAAGTGYTIANIAGLGTGVETPLTQPINATGGIVTYALIGTSGAALGLLNGNLTFSGNDAFSGTLNFSGLSTGTQVSCLGLSSGNAVVTAGCGGATFANPTATAGATAINGSATTAMRSDAAPAVAKAGANTFGITEPDGLTLLCPSGVCSTAVTDTATSGSFSSWNIGGQNDSTGTGTATLPTFAAGQSALLTAQSGSTVTIGLNSQTINGLGLNTTLHQFGFYGYTYNSAGVASVYGFPGFGTITTNALCKYIDATGACTASSISDNGTTVSTAENVTLSGATVTLSGVSAGTIASGKNLGLDTSNHVVLATVSGGSGGGGTFNYSDNGVTLSGTAFAPIGGGGAPSATEANVDVPSPSTLTVANLQVGLSAAPGVGNSVAVTLRDGGASQAVTCVISGASATTCSDLTHSFNVAQNDLIDWQIVTTGTIVGTPTITIAANNGTSSVGVTSVTAGTGPVVGQIATTGTVALDLTHANTWTGAQTFGAVNGGGNVQSGTTYTTVASDCGKTLLFTNAGAVTVTIAASIAPASGTICIMAILQGGASKVSGEWLGRVGRVSRERSLLHRHVRHNRLSNRYRAYHRFQHIHRLFNRRRIIGPCA